MLAIRSGRAGRRSRALPPFEGLRRVELAALQLAAGGLDNAAIAGLMGVGVTQIPTYLRGARDASGTRDERALVAWYWRTLTLHVTAADR